MALAQLVHPDRGVRWSLVPFLARGIEEVDIPGYFPIPTQDLGYCLSSPAMGIIEVCSPRVWDDLGRDLGRALAIFGEHVDPDNAQADPSLGTGANYAHVNCLGTVETLGAGGREQGQETRLILMAVKMFTEGIQRIGQGDKSRNPARLL